MATTAYDAAVAYDAALRYDGVHTVTGTGGMGGTYALPAHRPRAPQPPPPRPVPVFIGTVAGVSLSRCRVKGVVTVNDDELALLLLDAL